MTRVYSELLVTMQRSVGEILGPGIHVDVT